MQDSPLDRLLGRSSGLDNVQQFVTERIEGKKPETNRERRNCGWIAEITDVAADEEGP